MGGAAVAGIGCGSHRGMTGVGAGFGGGLTAWETIGTVAGVPAGSLSCLALGLKSL